MTFSNSDQNRVDAPAERTTIVSSCEAWGTAGDANEKAPEPFDSGASNKIRAVSYSHMGRPHTTIGAERFHFRVRKGIGWFPLAIAARKTGLPLAIWIFPTNQVVAHTSHSVLWCYMAKPHVQLVLVSFIHY